METRQPPKTLLGLVAIAAVALALAGCTSVTPDSQAKGDASSPTASSPTASSPAASSPAASSPNPEASTGASAPCYEQQPRKDCSNADFSGANLSNKDLSGVNFYKANLATADLSGANLSGANLNMANLEQAKLPRANLRAAQMDGTRLTYADLTGADLRGAKGTAPDFTEANFTNADMSDFFYVDGANFTNATLTGVKVGPTVFDNAQLSGVISGNINGSSMVLPNNWTLVSGNLIGPGAHLVGANLASAGLNGLNMTAVLSWDSDLSKANLRGANLTFSRWWNANMAGVDLTGANLDGAIFSCAERPDDCDKKMNLSRANLSNVTGGLWLVKVDLTGADLTGAVFDGVGQFDGVDLTGSKVDGVKWGQITFTDTTCPDGTSKPNYSNTYPCTP